MTNHIEWFIITIEKGKTSNGYAKYSLLVKKITHFALVGWRYFFMEITKSNKIIINEIMYSLSISLTSLHRDDGITARFCVVGLTQNLLYTKTYQKATNI